MKETFRFIIFDISFEETLKRHSQRNKNQEFGVVEMKRWWLPEDYLGLAGEQRLSEQLSEKADYQANFSRYSVVSAALFLEKWMLWYDKKRRSGFNGLPRTIKKIYHLKS